MQKGILSLMMLLTGTAIAAHAEGSSPVYDIPLMKKVVIDGNAADWGDKGFRVGLMVPLEAEPKQPKGDTLVLGK